MTTVTPTPEPSVAQTLIALTAPALPPSGDYQRTMAENRAAAILAHDFPRTVERCREEMRFACSQLSIAEDAFYVLKSERNGRPKIVTGTTIKFARELARCWHNIHYDAIEVARTETHSQILTYAVDLETNVRGSVQNIVAHLGRKTSTEIYEHNASDASRRLREIILNILPGWFVAEGEALCRKTLEGEFSPERVAEVIAGLTAIGVSHERIEREIGRKLETFRPIDLASLVIKARTIERGDMRADDVFETSTADDLIRELVPDKKRDQSRGANGARHVGDAERTPGPQIPSQGEHGRRGTPGTGKGPPAKPSPAAPRGPGEQSPPAGGPQPSAAGGVSGGELADDQPGLGQPVAAGDEDGTARPDTQRTQPTPAKAPATPPPPSIAALAAGQGRSAAEPQIAAKAPDVPTVPLKRGRGRPPKAKPEGAAPPQQAPKAITAAKKPRLDLNGSPDADDDPEAFSIYWMNRLRVVPADQEPLAEMIDKHVRAKLKDLKSMLIRWKSAVDMRLKKIARAAELAKAH